MAANNRIFYACQGVFTAESGGSLTFLKGVQTVGITPSQEISSLAGIGRSQKFATLYNKPNVEISIERVLEQSDDARFFTLGDSPGTYAGSYFLNANNFGMQIGSDSTRIKQYDIRLLYTEDGEDNITEGDAIDTYDFKYCLLKTLSYSMTVEGSVKETLTFSGKIQDHTSGGSSASETFPQSARNLRRQDVSIATATLPTELNEIISAYPDADQAIQSVAINLTINYQQLTDIGKWRGATSQSKVNDFTYVTLPLEVTCSFTIVARKGMQRDILMKDTNFMGTFPDPDRQIIIPIETVKTGSSSTNYIFWDLGQKNYLTSISTGGGDTGGGNVEMTFEYANTNNDYVAYGPRSSAVTLTPSDL